MASVLATFKDYPQRQKVATFNLDEVLQEMKENGGSKSTSDRRPQARYRVDRHGRRIGRHLEQLGKGDSVMLRPPCPLPPWFVKTWRPAAAARRARAAA